MRHSPTLLKMLGLFVALACSACAPSVSAPAAPATPAAPVAAADQSGGLLARLRAVSAASACTTHAQCRSIGIGVKACGGPEAYLPFSTDKEQEARALAGRYTQQRVTALAKQSDQFSNCMATPDPGAQCRAGLCVPGGGAGGARAD